MPAAAFAWFTAPIGAPFAWCTAPSIPACACSKYSRLCRAHLQPRALRIAADPDCSHICVAFLQVLSRCPDIDRAMGRAFLGRTSPSEFARVMHACASLPAGLLGKADGIAPDDKLSDLMPGTPIALQGFLQEACSAEVGMAL
jgi:hypothetical protein